ncbi:hypothetical protein [Aliamphritea spongicola]|uniref:hypothetical protein n=1 Tax=Aliamphritea spongicola TaxID=707589 RepID=UPI00196B6774|nr:hypothetical protein [Aliamphritea spongicola]MBN3561704.1 hypothetical protein [Aliamphritea spongicola]
MRKYMILLAMLFALPASAHNVVGGVYAIGSTIEGEAGFSNGDMAQAGTKVLVTDPAGNVLMETETDEEGFFTFEATTRVDHLFRMEMGSGHVLEMVLSADELPSSLAAGAVTTAAPAAKAAGGTAVQYDEAAMQGMIEKAVAKQVKPLRKELRAYQEKAGLQDILGGIGYIFGLCGIGMWWRQRKQAQAAKAV